MSSYIVSFIVFPYTSRILGVDMLGRTGFVDNVVMYFSLFSIMGISILGVREIAACGDNKERRSQIFSSIFTLLLLQTFIVVLIFLGSILVVPRFRTVSNLMFIGAVSLFFSSLTLEWFYQGIENFKYIAIRTLAIRVAYAVSVFLFIHNSDDYVLYFTLTTGVVVANALINIAYSRHFVVFSIKHIHLRSLFKSSCSLGLYKMMTSMYTTFNIIFLGFVCSETIVGYYYVATKIYGICIAVLMAYTSVMLPRMSNLLSNNNIEEFNEKIQKSIELILSTALPLVIFCVILAPQIIGLLSGSGYEGAILPMQIIMFVLLISGMAQIWVIQLLMPMKKDGIILYGAIIGAIVGVSANFLLVKSYGAVGTAIVLLLSEFAGNMFTLQYVVRKKLFKVSKQLVFRTTLKCIPYIAICVISASVLKSNFSIICVATLLSLLYFLSLKMNSFSYITYNRH